MAKLAKRTKLGLQLYNCRRLMRSQMEKIRFIKDDLTLVALEELLKCEQTLFRIETGMWGHKLQLVSVPEETVPEEIEKYDDPNDPIQD